MLVVRPASCITGSSRKTEESPSAKAGHSHLPLPISTQARRKSWASDKRPFLGCCHSTSSVNEVREGDHLVAYQFVARCGNCAKQFGVIWVMDPTRSVGRKTVARITCPLCKKRFDQDAKDLLEIGSKIQDLVVGRPVRSVEVDYDCPYCSHRGILVSLLHTDLSWDELSMEHVQTAVCDNGLCLQRGVLQKLKPSRVLLGSLNPV